MQIDCVFSGGGVKGYAFIGAVQSLKEHQINIERVAGTSAGAIFAALIAAQYTIDEIETILFEMQTDDILDPPILSKYISFMKWIILYRKMGIYKGDKLENWLTELLAEKGVHTFADLAPGTLKIVVSDISLGKLVVIPDDLQRIYGVNPNQFKVATAVRMSASYPYFFMPKKLCYQRTYSYIVDGGVLSNFPLWIFRNNNRDKRPVLGVSLSDTIEHAPEVKINQSIDMFRALFLTMMQAHDARYISKSKQNHIVFLPVKSFTSLNMSMNKSDKKQLCVIGYNEMNSFLKRWPT